MRCKPGDLALVIKSTLNHVGMLCYVVERSGLLDMDWHIELLGHPSDHSTGLWSAKDSWLRPIRDSDGQDETLTWAPKKEPIETR